MSNISNMTVPPGTISESVTKNLAQLFCTLGSLTKYFMLRSTKSNAVFQGARFEHLVKLTGKQLAPIVYKFILYLEESQKENADSTQNKKKKKHVDSNQMKNKILRETRLLPKVVYEMEQFSKCIIQLSNKTKIDLSRFVGQGVVRDFRIVHLKEVLEQRQDVNEDFSFASDTTPDTTAATAQDIEMNEDGNEDEGDTHIEEVSDEDAESRPAKRPRL